MHQQFQNEVERPFSQALDRFNNLVRIAHAEYSSYEDRPLDENYFRNPTMQDAISATHAALTEVHNIAQSHVEKYTNLICQQSAKIGELEHMVSRHRNETDVLLRSKRLLESTLASLQDSINHAQRMVDDTRGQLDDQRRQLGDREHTRDAMKWLLLVPVVGVIGWGIGHAITDAEVCAMANRVRDSEKDLRDQQEAKDKAQEHMDQENAKIADTENAEAIAKGQLLLARASLDSLLQEIDTLSTMGGNLKSSTAFIAEFQGKVNVLYETNRIAVMFHAIIRSLGDLLPFIATRIDNQVAVLSSKESLERLRRLLTTRILPSAQDLKGLEF